MAVSDLDRNRTEPLQPAIADRLAKKITKRSEDAMASDRRLAGLIFDLSAAPQAAGELRSYGLAPRLKALHGSLIGTLSRRAGREAGPLASAVRGQEVRGAVGGGRARLAAHIQSGPMRWQVARCSALSAARSSARSSSWRSRGSLMV